MFCVMIHTEARVVTSTAQTNKAMNIYNTGGIGEILCVMIYTGVQVVKSMAEKSKTTNICNAGGIREIFCVMIHTEARVVTCMAQTNKAKNISKYRRNKRNHVCHDLYRSTGCNEDGQNDSKSTNECSFANSCWPCFSVL
jgi:hypothetical protein